VVVGLVVLVVLVVLVDRLRLAKLRGRGWLLQASPRNPVVTIR
jgi:hypothetical protein